MVVPARATGRRSARAERLGRCAVAKRAEARFGVDGDDGGRARTSRAGVFRAARSWPGPRACPRACRATGSPTWTLGGTSRTSPRRAPNPSHPETQTPRAARARELCRAACLARPPPSRPRRTPTASCVRPRSSSTRCGRSWRATGEAREVVSAPAAEKAQQRRSASARTRRSRAFRGCASLEKKQDRIFDFVWLVSQHRLEFCADETTRHTQSDIRFRWNVFDRAIFFPRTQKVVAALSIGAFACRVSAFSRRTEVHGAFFFFGESAFRDESERRYPDARKTTTHRARSRARRLEKRSPRGLPLRRRLSLRRRLRKERS